jgi:hypothetical protein
MRLDRVRLVRSSRAARMVSASGLPFRPYAKASRSETTVISMSAESCATTRKRKRRLSRVPPNSGGPFDPNKHYVLCLAMGSAMSAWPRARPSRPSRQAQGRPSFTTGRRRPPPGAALRGLAQAPSPHQYMSRARSAAHVPAAPAGRPSRKCLATRDRRRSEGRWRPSSTGTPRGVRYHGPCRGSH